MNDATQKIITYIVQGHDNGTLFTFSLFFIFCFSLKWREQVKIMKRINEKQHNFRFITERERERKRSLWRVGKFSTTRIRMRGRQRWSWEDGLKWEWVAWMNERRRENDTLKKKASRLLFSLVVRSDENWSGSHNGNWLNVALLFAQQSGCWKFYVYVRISFLSVSLDRNFHETLLTLRVYFCTASFFKCYK